MFKFISSFMCKNNSSDSRHDKTKVNEIVDLLSPSDRTDYLGQAGAAKQRALAAIKNKNYDIAWKEFHIQKEMYLKQAARSGHDKTWILANDGSVSLHLANILRIEGKHLDALVHIIYWISTAYEDTKNSKNKETKLLAYFKRAKLHAASIEDLQKFIRSRESQDFESVRSWVRSKQ